MPALQMIDSTGLIAEGPPPVEVDPSRHATSWLWEQSPSGDRRPVVFYPGKDGWVALDKAEVALQVAGLASGMIAAGVDSGDRVALMGATAWEWPLTDLAILAAGGVTVPIYDSSPVSQCERILADSSPRLAIARTRRQAERLRDAWGAEGGRVACIDAGGPDELARGGRQPDRDELDRRLAALDGSCLATIVYAPDGEVLVRGGNVFAGYHGDDEATARALIDGWFHSGDLGRLDGEGFLAITGRKKELIVTATGKMVASAPFEDSLRAHSLVAEAMIVGDGRPYLGALVTLDEEGVEALPRAGADAGGRRSHRRRGCPERDRPRPGEGEPGRVTRGVGAAVRHSRSPVLRGAG